MSLDFKPSALVALLFVVPCVVAAERDDILIADFEGKDYGDWKVEGEAFGLGPARGTLPNQMEVSEFQGEGLANSFYDGDESTGKLTSPEFTINRKFLNLLVGGGGYEGETYVSLLVDGQVVRTAMGPNTQPGGSERLSWASWDVGEFTGKKAVIQIVDRHTGDGRHITVDHIVLSDHQMSDQAWWQGLLSALMGIPWLLTVLRLFVAIPLPWYLGQRLAKYLRMPDYGWKLSLIFCTLASAGVIVQVGTLNLGVDLEGGDILVYEVDRKALGEEDEPASPLDVDWGRLIEAIKSRINPSGTKEIVVRRYGEWQIEIIIPKVDRREIKQIKRLISTAGSLEFRIVAKRNHAPHGYVIGLAEELARDPDRRRSKYVRDGDDIVGYWSEVGRVDPRSFKRGERGEWEKLWKRAIQSRKGRGDATPEALANENKGPFRVQVADDVIRDAGTGELITFPSTFQASTKYALEEYLIDQGIHEIDVLMIVDKDLHVTGEHLGMVSSGYDETMRPCVRFNTKGQGVGLMAGLTGSNLPDTQRNFYQRMAILLDGRVLSAPRIMSTISDRGQITGDFTTEEVDFLVGILHAGSLPAAVNEEPISENQIGAVLGEDTIKKGKYAIGISLAAVLVFILVWYRFAGIVACLALAVNLLLILALMMTFSAAVTLPGLAGLVLTVGMSVDANVLIFERLREELNRGAALRMAIRNGFSRATTTIVDANLTTLITAIVLYAIGTDQIRGFAVTLILGILMSMFTAIFCARVVFDLFERKRRLKTLNMRRMVGETHIDFIGRRKIAAVVSTLLIIVGLVAVGVRGAQIFDIDFAGGSSVTMVLEQETDEATIRSKLDEAFASLEADESSIQYSVNRVDVEDLPTNTVWKIDASIADQNEIQRLSLPDGANGGTFALTFGGETTTAIAHNADAATVKSALETLAGIDEVTVTAGSDYWDIEFIGTQTGRDVPLLQAGVLSITSRDKTQRVLLPEGANGGTFALTFDGETTEAIAHNADAAALGAALEALAGIDEVTVTSGSGYWDIEFAGVHADQDVPILRGDGGNLSGLLSVSAQAQQDGARGSQLLQAILQDAFTVAYYSIDFAELTETCTVVPTTPKKEEGTEPEQKEPVEAGKPKSKKKPDVDPKEASPQPAKADKASEEPKEASKPTAAAKDDPAPSKNEATPANKTEESGGAKPEGDGEEKPKPGDQGAARTDLPPDNVLALAGDGALLLAQAEPKEDAPDDSAEGKPEEEPKIPVEEKPATTETSSPAEEGTSEPKSEAPADDKPSEKPSAGPVDDKPKEASEEKPDQTEAPKPEDASTEKPPKKEAVPPEKPQPKDEPAPPKDETSVPEGTAADPKPVEEPASKAKDKPSAGKVDEGAADAKPSAPKTKETQKKSDKPVTPAPPRRQKITTRSQLEFRYEISGLALRGEILDAATAPGVDVTLAEEDVVALQPVEAPGGWQIEDSKGYKKWDVTLATNKEKAAAIFEHMKVEVDGTPYWLSSSAIGGKVAGDTRMLAIAALLTSLIGIVGYIWIRFQRVVFGLAAVVALVHDVLITLGAIAVSAFAVKWLAPAMGLLLIEEFKISLPVVAAFLTIIGYSLNDTIVVFDRIREVRGKSPDLTSEMVNTSINQTLGRTILTSLTTFLVVLILYTLGGQGIHGFAFALVIGVIVGTYSSIFVASPALLWMSQPKKA